MRDVSVVQTQERALKKSRKSRWFSSSSSSKKAPSASDGGGDSDKALEKDSKATKGSNSVTESYFTQKYRAYQEARAERKKSFRAYEKASSSKAVSGDNAGGDEDHDEEAHKLLDNGDNTGSTTESGQGRGLDKKASSSSSSSLTKQDSIGSGRSWTWSRSTSRNSGAKMGLSTSQSLRSEATTSASEDNDIGGSIDEMLVAPPSFNAKGQSSSRNLHESQNTNSERANQGSTSTPGTNIARGDQNTSRSASSSVVSSASSTPAGSASRSSVRSPLSASTTNKARKDLTAVDIGI